MTKQQIGTLALGALAAVVACDNGGATESGGTLGGDCPIGMFRPVGLADCVFPAGDANGTPLTTSDNRCQLGQPASPPSCVSESGQRDYLAASGPCAAGYRFEPGTCDRDTTGAAGVSTGAAGDATGAAGFPDGEAGVFGCAGLSGEAGDGVAGEGLQTGGAGGSASPQLDCTGHTDPNGAAGFFPICVQNGTGGIIGAM